MVELNFHLGPIGSGRAAGRAGCSSWAARTWTRGRGRCWCFPWSGVPLTRACNAVYAATSRSTTARPVSALAVPSFFGSLTNRAADVNPIGAISKTDLKKFIAYARDAFDLPVLTECVLSLSAI